MPTHRGHRRHDGPGDREGASPSAAVAVLMVRAPADVALTVTRVGDGSAEGDRAARTLIRELQATRRELLAGQRGDASSLVDWCADGLDALDCGDTARVRAALVALRARLEPA